MRAVSRIGENLGMQVSTQIAAQPKVYFRAPYECGSGRLRLKVEVNTYERVSSKPLLSPLYS